MTQIIRGVLAGMVGFEPTVHCTKNSCLTTWLHPSNEALDTPETHADQPLFVGIFIPEGRLGAISPLRRLRAVPHRRSGSMRGHPLG